MSLHASIANAIRTITRPSRGVALPALVGGAALLTAPVQVDGASVEQPGIRIINDDTKSLDYTFTNDDAGAVYNSAEFNQLPGIIDQIHALPWNEDKYASAEEIADLLDGRIFNQGDISDGWDFSGFDPVELTHNQGIPGVSYDEWTEGNSMLFSVKIPLDLLTASGDSAFYGDVGLGGPYVEFSLSDSTFEDGFVGISADGFSQWPATTRAYNIHLIPEPGTLFFLLAGASGFLFRRGSHRVGVAG